MTDADALLAEIIANPADDLLRLAFADAIEERDGPSDEAWAAFVRVQVEMSKRDDERCGCRECRPKGQHNNGPCRSPLKELRRRESVLACEIDSVFGDLPMYWTTEQIPLAQGIVVRRGFPAVVRCNLHEWRCGDCASCYGRPRSAYPETLRPFPGCPKCHGTGRIPGIGPRLAQQWPVERVEVTDAEFLHNDPARDRLSLAFLGGLPETITEGRIHLIHMCGTQQELRAELSKYLLAEARAQPLEVTT